MDALSQQQRGRRAHAAEREAALSRVFRLKGANEPSGAADERKMIVQASVLEHGRADTNTQPRLWAEACCQGNQVFHSPEEVLQGSSSQITGLQVLHAPFRGIPVCDLRPRPRRSRGWSRSSTPEPRLHSQQEGEQLRQNQVCRDPKRIPPHICVSGSL